MYAKLVNGTLRSAPKKVNYNNTTIFNPKEDTLLALGYLPVTYTAMPDDAPDGKHYESSWTETDEEIIQTWTLVDAITYEEETTMADLVEAVERGLNS